MELALCGHHPLAAVCHQPLFDAHLFSHVCRDNLSNVGPGALLCWDDSFHLTDSHLCVEVSSARPLGEYQSVLTFVPPNSCKADVWAQTAIEIFCLITFSGKSELLLKTHPLIMIIELDFSVLGPACIRPVEQKRMVGDHHHSFGATTNGDAHRECVRCRSRLWLVTSSSEKIQSFYQAPENLPSPLNCGSSGSLSLKLATRYVWQVPLCATTTLTNQIFLSVVRRIFVHHDFETLIYSPIVIVVTRGSQFAAELLAVGITWWYTYRSYRIRKEVNLGKPISSLLVYNGESAISYIILFPADAMDECAGSMYFL